MEVKSFKKLYDYTRVLVLNDILYCYHVQNKEDLSIHVASPFRNREFIFEGKFRTFRPIGGLG